MRLQAAFEELTHPLMLQIAGYRVLLASGFKWGSVVNQSSCTARREWLATEEECQHLHSS